MKIFFKNRNQESIESNDILEIYESGLELHIITKEDARDISIIDSDRRDRILSELAKAGIIIYI